MKWSVVWMKSTRIELARAFLAARKDGRDLEFAEALDRIDARLTRRPAEIGESRVANNRIYVDLPVLVEYEISEADHVVLVVRVRFVPFRGSPPPSSDNAGPVS